MKQNFIELYSRINEMEKLFTPTNCGSGVIICNEGATINSNSDFITWKEEIIFELETLKRNSYIENALKFLNGESFTGWHDKTDFKKLKGILETINKRIDEFYKGDESLKNMFEQFMNDIVDLQKEGKIVESNIKASVQKEKIFINRSDINIEEGDYLIRHLPNGAIEHYLVLDRGFYSGFNNIMPAHYQCKVKKENNIDAKTSNSSTINNYGKINMYSVDNSINTIDNNDSVLFENLLNEAKKINNNEIIKAIQEMEKSKNNSSFKEKYSSFMQLAANHMTLFAPFIPALTNFIK